MSEPGTPHGPAEASPLDPEAVVPRMTFIVRFSATAAGRVIGVVEHLATGRKERFDGLDGLGQVLAALSDIVGGPRISRCTSPQP